MDASTAISLACAGAPRGARAPRAPTTPCGLAWPAVRRGALAPRAATAAEPPPPARLKRNPLSCCRPPPLAPALSAAAAGTFPILPVISCSRTPPPHRPPPELSAATPKHAPPPHTHSTVCPGRGHVPNPSDANQPRHAAWRRAAAGAGDRFLAGGRAGAGRVLGGRLGAAGEAGAARPFGAGDAARGARRRAPGGARSHGGRAGAGRGRRRALGAAGGLAEWRGLGPRGTWRAAAVCSGPASTAASIGGVCRRRALVRPVAHARRFPRPSSLHAQPHRFSPYVLAEGALWALAVVCRIEAICTIGLVERSPPIYYTRTRCQGCKY